MSQNTTFTNKVIKCDLCPWEGTTAAAGPHVLRSHLREIDSRILSFINDKGTTVEQIVSATGFPQDRVRGRFKNLARRGKIALVRTKNQYIAFTPNASVEFNKVTEGTARCSSCGKVRLTTFFAYRNRKKNLRRGECKKCISQGSVKESAPVTVATKVIERAAAPAPKNDVLDTLMGQIHRKADEALKEKYKDEYDELVKARVDAIFTNLMQFTNK